MRRVVGRAAASLVLGVLALGVTTAGAAPAESGAWLGLAGGDVGAFHWSVEAKRPDGPAGAGRDGNLRPCLLVGTTWRLGPYSYRRSRSRQCAGDQGLSASGPPLVAKGAQPSSGGTPRLTAIGMIFAPSARVLRVTMAGGAVRTIHLAKLSPSQARAVRLAPFRYAAFAAHGEWCAERFVVESASGRVLWDSGVDGYTCGTTSSVPQFEG